MSSTILSGYRLASLFRPLALFPILLGTMSVAYGNQYEALSGEQTIPGNIHYEGDDPMFALAENYSTPPIQANSILPATISIS